jgi:hypothetical protein
LSALEGIPRLALPGPLPINTTRHPSLIKMTHEVSQE